MALAIYLGAPADSSEIKALPGREGLVIIQILGQIELGDADLFVSSVQWAKAAGKAGKSVRLNLRAADLWKAQN
jgi:hypothetical protein